MLVTVAKLGMTGNEQRGEIAWDHDFSIQHV